MEYTKSEIREQKKRIKHELKKIEDWLPYVENNWMSWVMITSALEALKRVLSPLKTHIIDNDDFNVAIDINNMLVSVWDVYFNKVNSKELEAHSATWDVYDIVKDLRDWIGEYESEHPKQPNTPIDNPLTKNDGEDETTKGIIDTDKLKELFIKSFFDKDYSVFETATKTIKQSRFDKMCQHLEMMLMDTDKPIKQQDIGRIAYMIYYSPYTKPDYSMPTRKGIKGRFAPLVRTFFDIVGMDKPSETSPNKYIPTEDVILFFGDILKYEQPSS